MSAEKKPEIIYSKYFLPNGIKCITYKRPEIHSVNINIAIRTGALDEDEKTNGLSHFIEHVVHNGTVEMPTWQDIDKLTSDYSGSVNAFTNIDITQYYGTFPHKYLDQALYYFSQIVFHPLLKSSDIEKERAIILDEYTRHTDEVSFDVFKNLKENRFKTKNTPFAFDIIGTKKLLSNFTVEDITAFYKKHYIPENIEIYIVGNFNEEYLKKELTKLFNDSIQDKVFTFKTPRIYKKQFPEYSKYRIKAIQKSELNQYYLTISFPGLDTISSNPEDRIRQNFVANMTASSNFSQSILWKRLREELGIVYGVESWIYQMNSRAIFVIQTSFDKQYLEQVLMEVYSAINKIRNGEITDFVFNARKKRKLDTMLMRLDDPEQALAWVMNYEEQIYEHGRAFTIQKFLEFVEHVSFESVLDIAKQIYAFDKINIGIVSKDPKSEVESKAEEIWARVSRPMLI